MNFVITVIPPTRGYLGASKSVCLWDLNVQVLGHDKISAYKVCAYKWWYP